MTKLLDVDWPLFTRGDIDHRIVNAPYIRLDSFTQGDNGDIVYLYDLRVMQPNKNRMTTLQLHSLEHLFLYGFRKYLKKHFISFAPMGCQTGFYIVLLNEGRYSKLYEILYKICIDITRSTVVPYVSDISCGQSIHHSIEEAKEVIYKLLDCQDNWNNIILKE